MAVRLGDDFSELFNDDRYNRRFEMWLWFYLRKYHAANFSPDIFLGGEIRQEFVEFIKHRDINITTIKNSRDASLILDSNLNWIGKETRQHTWLINYLIKNHNFSINGIANLQGRDRVICTIDTMDINLDQKKSLLDNTKIRWHLQTKEDKFFDWFKQENQERRYEIASDFTNKKFKELTTPIAHTYEFKPTQALFTNHEELLIFFDLQTISTNEKKFWLDCVKKQYNQQQYRKNLKEKKQYNFILTKTTVSKLDELAIQYELSRADVIEILIKMEAKKPTHLHEQLRYVEQMTLQESTILPTVQSHTTEASALTSLAVEAATAQDPQSSKVKIEIRKKQVTPC